MQLATKFIFLNEWKEIFNTLWLNTCIYLQPYNSLVEKYGYLVD